MIQHLDPSLFSSELEIFDTKTTNAIELTNENEEVQEDIHEEIHGKD